jgi:D-beta-D-heptose 7-phosphate kinase/D-beta-D-heptose 1-phosphate adenosyltransferase
MTAPPAGDEAADAAAALVAAVRGLGRASVLVVGDAMLDRYMFGEVERVSPEAPVPVLLVERELSLPGGAGNVVRNLGALGAAVAFVSIVGDDQSGSDLTGLIGGQPGVEPWLLVQGGRATTTKTRMVAQGQQLLRVDREDTAPVHEKLAERLLRIARDAMAATSVTVFSDYRKGLLAGGLPQALVQAAKAAGRPVVVDLRGADFAAYAGADVIFVPRRELALMSGVAPEDDAAVAGAAVALRRAHEFGAVLVLRAEHGLMLVDAGGVTQLRGEALEVFDPSGAGDTATATLAAALATGCSLDIAARLANLAAGIALARSGTAVVRESDFLAALSPERGPARKIVGADTAAEQVERWRRRGLRSGFVPGAFDPLRAGHEHLLQQAALACERLVVAVASDAEVRRRKGEDRPLQPQAERAAQLAALPSVDLVVVPEGEDAATLLAALRPELLVTGADQVASDPVTAELMRGWGGQVLRAERLAEPA